MKMVKSLILGSAAGLLAMSGAQAADLPVKAKAVEYVKICSLYGAGFYYIPGTDTCIKLGGYLRVDLALNGNDYGPGLSSVLVRTIVSPTTTTAVLVRTSPSIPAPRPNTAWCVPSRIWCSAGRPVPTPAAPPARSPIRWPAPLAAARLVAPASVSTTRSSSSLDSRSVARSRPSTHRGRAIRLAVLTPFRAAATTSPA